MNNDEENTLHQAPGEVASGSGSPAPGEGDAARAAAISRSIESLFSGGRAPEGSPAAEPTGGEEAVAEVHPFLTLIQSYQGASREGREAVGAEVWRQASELEQRGELDPLAGGIALLILGATGTPDASGPTEGSGEDEPEALKMARAFTTPQVADRLVLHLGAERDESARNSWMQIAFHLPEVMAPALADALADDRNRGARRAYLEAMKALGERGLEWAVRMLDDERWFVVRNGVHLVADFGDDQAVGQLTATLAHPDPRVRRETVMSLAKLGGEDAELLLLGLLADPDLDVREAATMAVGVLKVQRALRPLLARLEEEESEDVLVQILRSLGQIGDPGAVPEIEKRAVGGFFSRPRAAVRIAAYRALAGIGTPHARSVLEKAEQDGDPEVRTAVSGILSARTPRPAAG